MHSSSSSSSPFSPPTRTHTHAQHTHHTHTHTHTKTKKTNKQTNKQKSSQQIVVDVGEDSLLLAAHPRLYHLDLDLPFLINTEDTGAQFNKDTRVSPCYQNSCCKLIPIHFKISSTIHVNEFKMLSCLNCFDCKVPFFQHMWQS